MQPSIAAEAQVAGSRPRLRPLPLVSAPAGGLPRPGFQPSSLKLIPPLAPQRSSPFEASFVPSQALGPSPVRFLLDFPISPRARSLSLDSHSPVGLAELVVLLMAPALEHNDPDEALLSLVCTQTQREWWRW